MYLFHSQNLNVNVGLVKITTVISLPQTIGGEKSLDITLLNETPFDNKEKKGKFDLKKGLKSIMH